MPTKTQQRDDANESLFFARDLEYHESRVYEKKYPEIKFRQIFPVNNEGGPGALFVTYKMLDKTGLAQIISDYAMDLPRVNLSAIEVTKQAFSVADSAVYSQREIDAAMSTNTNLDGTLLSLMREAYERKLDEIADRGNVRSGLEGFNTNGNIPVLAPTVSAGPGDDTWPNKTADEIVADFMFAYNSIITNSAGVHRANAVILSPERMALLDQLRLSNTSSTLREYLDKAFRGVQFFDWTRMSTASSAGAQRMAVGQRDSEVLEFREPMAFRIYPLERQGLKYTYSGEGRTAGMVVRFPLAWVFMDGI